MRKDWPVNRYELTPHLQFGGQNVVAVRADNASQPASRWYTGAGIYRHVRVIVTDPVHIGQWATFVTAGQAGVRVQTTVVNQSGAVHTVALAIALVDPRGREVRTMTTQPQAILPGKGADFDQQTALANPDLWSLESPALYHATVRVLEGKTTLDNETVAFGIRDARFDAATGFWLNGKNFKIKGVCLHHDAGALGAAVPLRAWERRLEALRQLGVNAIRIAHNPADPAFLDLCDRMGFLVMDEMFDCWTVGKSPYDYHLYFRDWSQRDLTDTVRRDRNHPSVIIYSAGNEIHDTPHAELAKGILQGLVAAFHAADPTRPVTQALFRPNVSHDYDDGLADMLDVIGQNYRENEIMAAHEQKPTRKILGTENQQGRSVWVWLRDNPPYAGQFLWSGIDYLGEAGRWPNTTAGSGLLYRTGAIKPAGYERQSWWSSAPMVHITRRVAPQAVPVTDPGYEAYRRTMQTLYDDWTPANPQPHEENVEVYSNCEQVELSLNGKSLGSKPLAADASPRNWRVAWEPGTIRAVCTNKGQVAATHELRTAGPAAKIVLSADRTRLTSDWDDVAYVTAQVVDEHGTVVPSSAHQIAFSVSGPGSVVAVDNSENASHESFQGTTRSAWEGQCYAIVRATGRITITATSPGLTKGTETFQ